MLDAPPILVASDLSARSDRPLDRALQLAAEMQRPLVLVHVIDKAAAASEQTKRWLHHLIEQDLGERMSAVSVRLEEGSAPSTLARVADDLDSALIVTGVARFNSPVDFVLGTSVDYLVRRSTVPVLVIRRRGGALLLLAFVAVEYRLSGYRNVLTEVTEHVILPLVLIAVPMALAGRWVIRRSLAPLDPADLGIEAAGSADRGYRVPTEELPVETILFVSAVNRLLARLDEAATRQEAFAADVAHELKTPLAVLNLELDALGAADAARLRQQVRAMTRLIDQLMLMAQLDADRVAGVERTPVSLKEVAADAVEMLAHGALAEGKQIQLEILGDHQILGRREAIGSALRNLIENGIHASPAAATVTAALDPADHRRSGRRARPGRHAAVTSPGPSRTRRSWPP